MGDDALGAESIESDPLNARLLEHLRAGAAPATSEYRMGAWELRVHPDLCERLVEVAGGARPVELFGVPGLATARGVVYAIAQGTSSILLRLPPGAARTAVMASRGAEDAALGPGWVRADAWLSDVARDRGTSLLASWVRAARTAAEAVGRA